MILVGEVGFEPTQPMAADLQSDATLQLRRSPKISCFLSAVVTIAHRKSRLHPLHDQRELSYCQRPFQPKGKVL
jgi:hypothetical protein